MHTLSLPSPLGGNVREVGQPIGRYLVLLDHYNVTGPVHHWPKVRLETRDIDDLQDQAPLYRIWCCIHLSCIFILRFLDLRGSLHNNMLWVPLGRCKNRSRMWM